MNTNDNENTVSEWYAPFLQTAYKGSRNCMSAKIKVQVEVLIDCVGFVCFKYHSRSLYIFNRLTTLHMGKTSSGHYSKVFNL